MNTFNYTPSHQLNLDLFLFGEEIEYWLDVSDNDMLTALGYLDKWKENLQVKLNSLNIPQNGYILSWRTRVTLIMEKCLIFNQDG